ncbi:hypothetical protein N1027_06930 [Herbiconiux sp. CPCC 205763]|uniref:Uncharacterized protein n=1 Tax=Herbiconiux aconitum TaxID=2970913 RepID=A0ABT2GNS7_9MICO|nr:hypothetical protein [Herbiconiux aconitum]MCS5717866.1 hypothetical protein [Herbiconiux aconitum]
MSKTSRPTRSTRSSTTTRKCSTTTSATRSSGEAWAGRSLTAAGARECLRLIEGNARLGSQLDALLPPGRDAQALLEQRRDGTFGTRAERRQLDTLEHAVYRPGASVEAEGELAALLLRLQADQEALDRAVAASGMLDQGASGSLTTSMPAPSQHAKPAEAAAPAPAPAGAAALGRRPSPRWWTRSGLLFAALGVAAIAGITVSVVQASVPRPSLEVFAEPAEPADQGRSDFVNQVLLQGVMGAGPVRYLGEMQGVRVFAALVGDTFHNPADPQEGVCLTAFLGSDRLNSSTTNCALRSDFDRLGVAVFFTESDSGELESSATADATRAIVWGPTGDLREVEGDELDRLVAAGCASNLSFRAREDCVR